jgi:hypothetical protein
MTNFASSPSLSGGAFTGNNATTGGGMYNTGSSNPSLIAVDFSGNTASNYGGGMENEGSSPTLNGGTFSNNSAARGGGILNTASNPQIRNSIVWGNTVGAVASSIANDGASTPVVSYSLVQNSFAGTGNINVDPQFVTPVPRPAPSFGATCACKAPRRPSTLATTPSSRPTAPT